MNLNQLVPVEPTTAMLAAGDVVARRFDGDHGYISAIYTAMLKAAVVSNVAPQASANPSEDRREGGPDTDMTQGDVKPGHAGACGAAPSLPATEPWRPLEHSAPVTNELVLRVADYAERAAENVYGEVNQLQAGIAAQFEAIREVGLLSVKFEQLLRRVKICDRNANILNGARELRIDLDDALVVTTAAKPTPWPFPNTSIRNSDRKERP